MDAIPPSGQKGFWFFLYPFIHLNITENTALIYNTLNGEMLEYRDEKIIGLLKKLDDWENLYVIGITADEMVPGVLNMIKEVRRTFSGDVIDFAKAKAKPIQFKPALKFFTANDELTFTTSFPLPEKNEIGSCLKEITLFLNDSCSQKCPDCAKIFKQVTYCTCSGKSMADFPVESLKELLNQLEETHLEQLNIAGANILEYSRLIEVTSILNQTPFEIHYHIHLNNLNFIQAWYTELGKSPKNTLNVLFPPKVDDYTTAEGINETIRSLQNNGVNLVYHFLAWSDAALSAIEHLINDYAIEQFEIHPYFNGNNLGFFRGNIFITMEALREYTISMGTIMTRKKINNLAFRQLAIMCDGDVYANLSQPKIGNIKGQSIFDSIIKEMSHGQSWQKTRNSVSPCKDCPYNCLCPPISNYDYVIGKFDICNIYNSLASKYAGESQP